MYEGRDPHRKDDPMSTDDPTTPEIDDATREAMRHPGETPGDSEPRSLRGVARLVHEAGWYEHAFSLLAGDETPAGTAEAIRDYLDTTGGSTDTHPHLTREALWSLDKLAATPREVRHVCNDCDEDVRADNSCGCPEQPEADAPSSWKPAPHPALDALADELLKQWTAAAPGSLGVNGSMVYTPVLTALQRRIAPFLPMPLPPRDRVAELTHPDRVALWDAINGYARACGGDTGEATISGARMDAVVAVESALAKLAKPLRVIASGPDAPSAAEVIEQLERAAPFILPVGADLQIERRPPFTPEQRRIAAIEELASFVYPHASAGLTFEAQDSRTITVRVGPQACAYAVETGSSGRALAIANLFWRFLSLAEERAARVRRFQRIVDDPLTGEEKSDPPPDVQVKPAPSRFEWERPEIFAAGPIDARGMFPPALPEPSPEVARALDTGIEPMRPAEAVAFVDRERKIGTVLLEDAILILTTGRTGRDAPCPICGVLGTRGEACDLAKRIARERVILYLVGAGATSLSLTETYLRGLVGVVPEVELPEQRAALLNCLELLYASAREPDPAPSGTPEPMRGCVPVRLWLAEPGIPSPLRQRGELIAEGYAGAVGGKWRRLGRWLWDLVWGPQSEARLLLRWYHEPDAEEGWGFVDAQGQNAARAWYNAEGLKLEERRVLITIEGDPPADDLKGLVEWLEDIGAEVVLQGRPR
jgi:hypothetical protein